MIVIPHHNRHGFFDGHQTDARVGFAILICLAVIAVMVILFATGTHFGFGPSLEPVAFLFIALPAVVVMITYMITLLDNEVHAAVYMVVFWGLTVTGLCALFYAYC